MIRLSSGRGVFLLNGPFSSTTRFMRLVEGFHNLIRTSATPGQNMNAYAHVLPQKETVLAGALRKDILSMTKAICASKF